MLRNSDNSMVLKNTAVHKLLYSATIFCFMSTSMHLQVCFKLIFNSNTAITGLDLTVRLSGKTDKKLK